MNRMDQTEEVACLNRKFGEVGRSQAADSPALYIRWLNFPSVGNDSHWRVIKNAVIRLCFTSELMWKNEWKNSS